MASKKITDFADGGSFQVDDAILIAREGKNYFVKGALVPNATDVANAVSLASNAVVQIEAATLTISNVSAQSANAVSLAANAAALASNVSTEVATYSDRITAAEIKADTAAAEIASTTSQANIALAQASGYSADIANAVTKAQNALNLASNTDARVGGFDARITNAETMAANSSTAVAQAVSQIEAFNAKVAGANAATEAAALLAANAVTQAIRAETKVDLAISQSANAVAQAGAAGAATAALQANVAALSNVARTGSYVDLLNRPAIPVVPTKLSDLANDRGFITLNDLPTDSGSGGGGGAAGGLTILTQSTPVPNMPDVKWYDFPWEKEEIDTVGAWSTTAPGTITVPPNARYVKFLISVAPASAYRAIKLIDKAGNSVIGASDYGETGFPGQVSTRWLACEPADFFKVQIWGPYGVPTFGFGPAFAQIEWAEALPVSGGGGGTGTTDISGVVSRVDAVEAQTANLATAISSVQGNVATSVGLITALQGNAGLLDARITQTGNAVSNAVSRVTTLEGNVASTATIIAGLSSQVVTSNTTATAALLLAANANTAASTALTLTSNLSSQVSSLRANAAVVSTQVSALQANAANLSAVALSGRYADLINPPVIPAVPTKLSDLVNDRGFITLADVPAGSGGGSAGSGGISIGFTSLSRSETFPVSGQVWADLPWMKEDYDASGLWDVANPARITIPKNVGYVRFLLSAAVARGGTKAFRILDKTGVSIGSVSNSSDPNFPVSIYTRWLPVSEGDYFTTQLYAGYGPLTFAEGPAYVQIEVADALPLGTGSSGNSVIDVSVLTSRVDVLEANASALGNAVALVSNASTVATSALSNANAAITQANSAISLAANASSLASNAISLASNATARLDRLAAVAVSGAFSDLTNKPFIPTNTTQLINDAGFISGYTVPNTGVTAGLYTNPSIVIGSDGRITSAENGAAPSAGTGTGASGQAAYKIVSLNRTQLYNSPAGWGSIPWDETVMDEVGAWNVANPTRITIPAGYTRVKIIVYTVFQNSSGKYVRLNKNDICIQNSLFQGVAESGNTLVTRWTPVVEGDYFDVAIHNNSGGLGGPVFGGPSYIEVTFG
jgi:hypothetical protein